MRRPLDPIVGAALAILAMLAAVPGASAPVLGQSACPAASPTPEPSAAPVLMPEEVRIRLFEEVWGAIDQGYIDPEFNGVDWAAVGDRYAPEFLAREDAWEVYDLAEQMVEELGDDETRFISPLVIENLTPEERDYVGIGALVDGQAGEDPDTTPRILYIFPGSGAQDAGLQPRDRIVSVNGDPCVTIRAIRGPEGTTVTLGVATPGQPVRDVVVERRRIAPLLEPIARPIGYGTVGYLRLPTLEGDAEFATQLARDLEALRDGGMRGLIIDVRSVGRGTPAMTFNLLSHVLDGDAGTLFSRGETSPVELPESDLLPDLRDLPLVVLVDADSAGEPERLAAILQAAGRAKVVGQATAGRTRIIQEVPLGDGSVLQMVTVDLELPDGTRPGRTGVVPDVLVDEDWLAYAEADDPFILAALDLLGAAARPTSPAPEPSGSPAPAA